MEIKSFKVKIDDLGNYQFIDKKDEEAFIRTLSFLSKSKGIEKLELSLNTIEVNSTAKQQELFKILCRKISQASGQYSYEHVSNSFLSYFGYSEIENFPKEKYNELLELSIAMANEEFNLNISINQENNHIEIM